MLRKNYRLKKNWEFKEVFKQMQKVGNSSFLIFFQKNQFNNCRFGIAISHKTFKRAVDRNHYRRQIRSIVVNWLKKKHNKCLLIINDHHHYNIVIVVRHSYSKNNFAVNQEYLNKLISSIVK